MKRTACMCISVCLYMWAYICIHMVPVDLFLCMCDFRDDTCNWTYTEEGELLCHDLCPLRTRGTVALGCTCRQMPMKEYFSPFLGI